MLIFSPFVLTVWVGLPAEDISEDIENEKEGYKKLEEVGRQGKLEEVYKS